MSAARNVLFGELAYLTEPEAKRLAREWSETDCIPYEAAQVAGLSRKGRLGSPAWVVRKTKQEETMPYVPPELKARILALTGAQKSRIMELSGWGRSRLHDVTMSEDRMRQLEELVSVVEKEFPSPEAAIRQPATAPGPAAAGASVGESAGSAPPPAEALSQDGSEAAEPASGGGPPGGAGGSGCITYPLSAVMGDPNPNLMTCSACRKQVYGLHCTGVCHACAQASTSEILRDAARKIVEASPCVWDRAKALEEAARHILAHKDGQTVAKAVLEIVGLV